MGHDVNIIGKHRLNTESVEALANDLSDKLGANIVYGYHEVFQWEICDNTKELNLSDGSGDWVELGRVISHPGEMDIQIRDYYYQARLISQAVSSKSLNIISPNDSLIEELNNAENWFDIERLKEDGSRVELSYVFKDLFSMYGDPGGRWSGFVHRLGQREPGPEPHSINCFRNEVKSFADKLGCDSVYYIDDQGPAMEVEYTGLWDDVVSKLKSISDENPEMEIISIPELLLNVDYGGPLNYSDTYYDDFSDLK